MRCVEQVICACPTPRAYPFVHTLGRELVLWGALSLPEIHTLRRFYFSCYCFLRAPAAAFQSRTSCWRPMIRGLNRCCSSQRLLACVIKLHVNKLRSSHPIFVRTTSAIASNGGPSLQGIGKPMKAEGPCPPVAATARKSHAKRSKGAGFNRPLPCDTQARTLHQERPWRISQQASCSRSPPPRLRCRRRGLHQGRQPRRSPRRRSSIPRRRG